MTEDSVGDIDLSQVAAAWYLAKIVGGEVPSVAHGGVADGLQYFPVKLDGVDYWLVEDALLVPPKTEEAPDQ